MEKTTLDNFLRLLDEIQHYGEDLTDPETKQLITAYRGKIVEIANRLEEQGLIVR